MVQVIQGKIVQESLKGEQNCLELRGGSSSRRLIRVSEGETTVHV